MKHAGGAVGGPAPGRNRPWPAGRSRLDGAMRRSPAVGADVGTQPAAHTTTPALTHAPTGRRPGCAARVVTRRAPWTRSRERWCTRWGRRQQRGPPRWRTWRS